MLPRDFHPEITPPPGNHVLRHSLMEHVHRRLRNGVGLEDALTSEFIVAEIEVLNVACVADFQGNFTCTKGEACGAACVEVNLECQSISNINRSQVPIDLKYQSISSINRSQVPIILKCQSISSVYRTQT